MGFLDFLRGRTSEKTSQTRLNVQDQAGYEQDILKGRQFLDEGEVAAALGEFERVLQLLPDSSVAYRYAGIAATRLGDVDLAHDYLILAIHYDEADGIAAIHLARNYLERDQPEKAIAVLKAASRANPTDLEVIFQLLCIRYERGEFQEAVRLLKVCLELQPRHVASLNLLGLILSREFGQLENGETQFRLALAEAPEFSPALSNLGWILSEMGQLHEALSCFNKVLDSDPHDAETRTMRSHALLKAGKFAAGWQDYHARHASPLAGPTKFEFRDWPANEHLAGNRVLVRAEQGLGDQIMFASCIQDIVMTGAVCTLECDPRLRVLLQRSFREIHVVSEGDIQISDSKTDVQLALGDLPQRFRPDLESFPRHMGYLKPHAGKVVAWKKRLAALGPGPYIGISWRGGTTKTRRHLRSVPLPEWEPILCQSAQFVSLQYGDNETDLRTIGDRGIVLHEWRDALDDYDETAAMIGALDLVISVCTAVVHLTGALGKTVWVMVPATPEWRYLSHGDTIPWYPSARLFRQPLEEIGTWTPTIHRTSMELGEFLNRIKK